MLRLPRVEVQSGTGGQTDGPAENGSTIELGLVMRDVLRTGPAPVGAGLLAVDLGEQLPQRRTLGEVISVGPVMAEEVVVRFDQQRQGCWNRFLADAEVNGAAHLVSGMVLANERLFHPAQPQHLLKERQRDIGRGSGDVDVGVVANPGDASMVELGFFHWSHVSRVMALADKARSQTSSR